jgi:hypothetical protein
MGFWLLLLDPLALFVRFRGGARLLSFRLLLAGGSLRIALVLLRLTCRNQVISAEGLSDQFFGFTYGTLDGSEDGQYRAADVVGHIDAP